MHAVLLLVLAVAVTVGVPFFLGPASHPFSCPFLVDAVVAVVVIGGDGGPSLSRSCLDMYPLLDLWHRCCASSFGWPSCCILSVSTFRLLVALIMVSRPSCIMVVVYVHAPLPLEIRSASTIFTRQDVFSRRSHAARSITVPEQSRHLVCVYSYVGVGCHAPFNPTLLVGVWSAIVEFSTS